MLIGSSKGKTITANKLGIHLAGVAGWAQSGTNPINTPLITFGCGTARVWDSGATWFRIETSKGVFDWTMLDAEMAIWTQGFSNIIYCLGQSPNWASGVSASGSYRPDPPTNPSDLADFAVALINRYPQITALEIWNEPDNATFWNGTSTQLAQLTKAVYDAVKAVKPSVKILSPCPQSFADRGATLGNYLRALTALGAQNCLDAISFHTYVMPRQPEYVGLLIDCVRGVMTGCGYNLPIYSTECGWGGITSAPSGSGWYDYTSGNLVYLTGSIMDQVQASSYIARMYLISLAKGIETQIFYAVDRDFSGIRLIDFSNKSQTYNSGTALSYLTKTVVNGNVYNYQNRGHMYSVDFSDSSGRGGTIYWCEDGKTRSLSTSGMSKATDYLGNTVDISNSSITIDLTPTYVWKY